MVIISCDSVQSTEVPKEIGLALSFGKTVIPFRLDKTEYNGKLLYDLNDTNYIDATIPTFDERIRDLAYAVRSEKQRQPIRQPSGGSSKHTSTNALIRRIALSVAAILLAAGALLFLPSSPLYFRTGKTVEPSATDKVNETVPASETEVPGSDWETAAPDKLYRPAPSLFIDQHTMYVFCIDTDVQDYAKMRFGPSRTHFNTIGTQINNYEAVTVTTESVNGWTLCYYNGKEGWVRSDYLFPDREEIRSRYGG